MHPISRFLSPSFRADRPVVVIAGRQRYPVLTIAGLRRAGVPVRLVAFEGETSEEVLNGFPEEERAILKVGQLGKLLKAIRRFEAASVIMVGQIAPGRLFRDLHPDFKALRILSRLKERNAATIFGAICREIESLGVTVLDARAFVDESIVSSGCLTGGRLKADPEHIEHGIRIAKNMAALDVGQGVVVRKGTVLAVEAFEGTDQMLARANQYRTDQLIFVKTSKPNQDFRYDVPVFGKRTLEVMHEHGIGLACLESERTIILDMREVVQDARKLGIQIYGY